MIYAAIFLTGLAIMALAVLHRLYRLWRDELSWKASRQARLNFYYGQAARTHQYFENMRRAGINAERGS